MYDFLKFPEQNQVFMNYDIENYLKTIYPTEYEKRILSCYVNKAEILYSFPFVDGNIVVILFDVNVENMKDSYFPSRLNLIKALQQSISERCLAIIRYGDVVKFFIYKSRINAKNKTRRIVETIHRSRSILLSDMTDKDKEFIDLLGLSTRQAKTTEELYYLWSIDIVKNKDIFDIGTCFFDFFESIKKDTYNQQKNIAIYKLQEGSIKDIENFIGTSVDFKNLFEGEEIDLSMEDQNYYVDFCSCFVRILFSELSNEKKMSPEEWIVLYLNSCNNYSIDLFNKCLNLESAMRITNSFNSKESPERYDEFGFYSVNDLKEYIGISYFDIL